MNAVAAALRGPAASRLLAGFGVDPKRYWLLMDLFHTMSERGEMMDQLGRNGVALNTAAAMYALLSALITAFALLAKARPVPYLAGFLFFTAFLFLAVLLSEAGNSLVNPVEGMVLAHQPITGATYTAAKLSHLLRIVLWLTPALDGVPAFAGLLLKGAPWYYPALHLGAAFATALLITFVCCSAFGWLMRFLPAKRLKAVGQFAGMLPFAGSMWMGQMFKGFQRLRPEQWLPANPAARLGLGAAVAVAAIAVVAQGIRSLSADYLIRVSAMMKGGSRAGATVRRSGAGAVVARLFGGQPARAAFAYVGRLMLRDWQFRRQFLSTAAPILFGIGSALATGWKLDPFAGSFSPIHFAPHGLGMLMIFVAALLPFGSDHKAAWLFQLVPVPVISGFAAGTYAPMAQFLVIAHAVEAPFLVWRWGAAHAALLLAFSGAASFVYAGLAVRMIEAIPFTRIPNPQRAAITLPILLLAVFGIAIAVALQHFVLFRSPAAVAAATVALAVAAWYAGRSGIRALAVSMRYQLAESSGESGSLYREVDA